MARTEKLVRKLARQIEKRGYEDGAEQLVTFAQGLLADGLLPEKLPGIAVERKGRTIAREREKVSRAEVAHVSAMHRVTRSGE